VSPRSLTASRSARPAVSQLDPPASGVRLYRADEIADPGQITGQVKEAILTAQVVIADITGVNPNVMWELGYADGHDKPIVILNQDPGSSPFDLADRRQVPYRTSPAQDDETNLVRHIAGAMRARNRVNNTGDPRTGSA
jgi:nucleoside 2-deoxyribosyltransferase